MSQNSPANDLDLPARTSDPPVGDVAQLIFFIDVCFLFLLEVDVIRAMWFERAASYDTHVKYSVPIVVLLPGLMAIAALKAVRKLSREGDIKPSAVARIQQGVGIILLLAYSAMQQLSGIAFR